MKLYRIAGLLLLASSLGAQTANPPNRADAWPSAGTGQQPLTTLSDNSTILFTPPPSQPMIQINGEQILKINDKDGKLMVNIDLDGKVTYGDSYKPEDSAKLFWQKLGETYPEMCVQYERIKREKEQEVPAPPQK